MSRLSLSIITARVETIRDETDGIAAALPASFEEYIDEAEVTRRYMLEHRLFIALSAMLDLMVHIAAASGIRFEDYAEAARSMHTAGVVDRDDAEGLVAAVGTRNAIAHLYSQLDQRAIYEALRSDRLREFARAVVRWTDGQGLRL